MNMLKRNLSLLASALLLVTSSHIACADGETKSSKITYVPPNRGAPAARVGGGTRGAGGAEVTLRVLAPEAVGLSATNQPSLFWYVSPNQNVRLELTIAEQDAIDPMLEQELSAGGEHAIGMLDLSKTAVHLQPNVEYQWSVSVVVDPAERSKDVMASGRVQFVPPPKALEDSTRGLSAEERAAAWAKSGYWYDALHAVATTAQAEPSATAAMGSLLEQVGLQDIRAGK